MKYFDLTQEEQEIEKALEKGEFVSVKNEAVVKRMMKRIAAFTLEKARNINLRLTQKTIVKLKAKAVAEGIPYQTLASSILHKYVNQ